MNLNLSRELEPQDDDSEEFKLPTPLPDWDDNEPFDRSFNRSGVFYVRFVCAQKLPSPVGSSVVGVASLPPFAGKVKTHRSAAYATYDHGVCVRWDRSSDDGLCSMVNPWNNEDSPVPSINIALCFSPLGMGILDFTMCTLRLSCAVLMKSPKVWKSQWCQALLPESMVADDNPLIKLEAMFAPTGADLTVEQPETAVSLSHFSLENPKSANKAPGKFAKQEASMGIVQSSPGLCDTSLEDRIYAKKNDNSTSSHLLRVASFFLPNVCQVCSTILIGKNKGFRCEACSVVCCADCRLNVDLELPCGSSEARARVERSIQSKISVGNILSIVAPDERYAKKAQDSLLSESAPAAGVPSAVHSQWLGKGIGCLRIEFKRAFVFDSPLPPDDSPDNVFSTSHPVREGEYYARITSSVDATKSGRTRPIYSGSPHFNSKEMEFLVSHYGEEFRLDCVEVKTDEVVGSALLSTHGILQNQRDEFVEHNGASLFQFFRGPLLEKGKRTMKVPFRRGVKNVFGLDFYVPSQQRALEFVGQESEKGAISGWLEIRLGLEEWVDLLYNRSKPLVCPERPPDEFNTATFQAHMNRVRILYEELSSIFEAYSYMVGWNNPVLTGSIFAFCVWLCVKMDMEFIGSLPAFALVLASIFCSTRRTMKGRKEPFIKREIEASRKAGQVSIGYAIHRPVGEISVSVRKGRALLSRDLGIPGKASCSVFYDPLRMAASQNARARILEYDKAADSLHYIGRTTAVLSSDPDFHEHFPSVENMRIRQVLRRAESFPADGYEPSTSSLTFPVLQPLEIKGRRRDANGLILDGTLKGWETSSGAIVVQVRVAPFDQMFGEVVIPFSQLVGKGEISGWFEVLEAGTKNLAPVRDHDSSENEIDIPRIEVWMKWDPPRENLGQEESKAVQEELLRMNQIAKQTQFDIVGTSLGAVNTALGLGENFQLVQNSVGGILDSIEIAINLFNFTDPFKSSMVFIVLFVVSLVLALVPTRYIALLLVMGQFGTTFINRYGDAARWVFGSMRSANAPQRVVNIPDSTRGGESPACLQMWLTNGLRSLPTIEDLRRAYFWEARRLGAKENEKYAAERREVRLQHLWKARWYSTVEILVDREKVSAGDCAAQWTRSFAVVEGRRFVFWESLLAFDNGELGTSLSLSGHSGITNPSPVEIREIPEGAVSRAVTIFGKGPTGQQRMTMILPDTSSKAALEKVMLEVGQKDD